MTLLGGCLSSCHTKFFPRYSKEARPSARPMLPSKRLGSSDSSGTNPASKRQNLPEVHPGRDSTFRLCPGLSCSLDRTTPRKKWLCCLQGWGAPGAAEPTKEPNSWGQGGQQQRKAPCHAKPLLCLSKPESVGIQEPQEQEADTMNHYSVLAPEHSPPRQVPLAVPAQVGLVRMRMAGQWGHITGLGNRHAGMLFPSWHHCEPQSKSQSFG